MKFRIWFLILACLYAFHGLGAEQIIMRNGQIFTGTIASQNRTDVVLDTPAGRVVLKKSEIRRITYGPSPEEQKRAAEEARRKEEERKAEEKRAADKKAEQDRKAAADKKLAEDKLRDEQSRLEADKKKAEADRLAKEKAEREAADRKKAEDKKTNEKKEESQITDEQMRQRIREEVKKELELAEKRKLEEARRQEELQRNTPNRLGAFMRSAVLPGWGQYYQGRRTPAIAYGVTFFSLAAISRQQDVIYNRRRSLYQASSGQFLFLTPYATRLRGITQDDATAQAVFLFGSTTNSHNYDRYKSASHGARSARGALLGFYAWNLADTLIFAPKTGVSLKSSGDALQFAYSLHF
ncbi:MAG: hypothetical protein K8S54_16645 [Spirochaetia bacterium]|nr:hypothetical protein [Spirochaetia bacterium]